MDFQKISHKEWEACVKSMPIFGIDLIIVLEEERVLMGKRLNKPAKGKFFVPGGRVYKDESRAEAFSRIINMETGLDYDLKRTESLGLYEHFYKIKMNEIDIYPTHYIIEARLINLTEADKKLNIKNDDQHSSLRWINIFNDISTEIHTYSLDYIKKLKENYKN